MDLVTQARHGENWQRLERSSKAGMERPGVVRANLAWQGKAGTARPVLGRHD